MLLPFLPAMVYPLDNIVEAVTNEVHPMLHLQESAA